MSSLDRLLMSSGVVVRHGDPRANGARRVFVHAGQVCVAREATEMTTILGSCVAICIWDDVSGIGGMNHFMLPQDIGTHHATPRYARHATVLLLDELRFAGAEASRLRAKVYGGACILGGAVATGRDLGALNAQVARELLHDARIPIVAEETGGDLGRKLLYHTATGETSVTKVHRVIP